MYLYQIPGLQKQLENMIKLFWVLFVIAPFNMNAVAQNNSSISKCNCSILIDPEYKGWVSVLTVPGGKLLQRIQHNFKSQDFLTLTISESSGDYFHVLASYSIDDGPDTKGWVKASKIIGIYSANYSENLILYDRPHSNGKKVVVVKEYINTFLKVVGCHQKWLKIELNYKGKKFVGWMPPEMQCDNPYTTCS